MLAYICRNLRRQSLTMEGEPQCQMKEILQNPNILATVGQLAEAIDAQVPVNSRKWEEPDVRKSASMQTIQTSSGRLLASREQPTSSFSRKSFSREGCGAESRLTIS